MGFLYALAGMATLFVVIALAFVTHGVFVYVVVALGAMFGLGAVHYWVWGKALEQEFAGEMEEEQLRQRALEDDSAWTHVRSSQQHERRE